MKLWHFFAAGLLYGSTLVVSCKVHAEPVVIPEEVVARCVAAGGCVMATQEQILALIKEAYEAGKAEGQLICRKTS